MFVSFNRLLIDMYYHFNNKYASYCLCIRFGSWKIEYDQYVTDGYFESLKGYEHKGQM